MVHLFTLLLIIFNIYNSILLKILNIINSIINNISKECKEFFISWVIIARHLKGAWQVALLPFRPNDLSIVSTCLAPWRCREMVKILWNSKIKSRAAGATRDFFGGGIEMTNCSVLIPFQSLRQPWHPMVLFLG